MEYYCTCCQNKVMLWMHYSDGHMPTNNRRKKKSSPNSSSAAGDEETAAKTKPKYIHLLSHIQQGSCTHTHAHTNATYMQFMGTSSHTHSPPHMDKKLIKNQIVTLSFTFCFLFPSRSNIYCFCPSAERDRSEGSASRQGGSR